MTYRISTSNESTPHPRDLAAWHSNRSEGSWQRFVSRIMVGIGIMNIMLVSITEWPREIGIRKAIGVREQDIMVQFLVETMLLNLSGWLMGIAWSWLIATALTSVGWTLVITGQSIVLAFACAGISGVVFGLWPALKAVHRDPVDSLRYE